MPDDSHTASVPRLTVRVGRYLPLLLLLGLAVHLILPQMTTLSHSLKVIKGMVLWAVALAGVGIVEGTMAALYDGLGVPDGVTVVVVLTYRGLSFWLPTMLGFPLIPYLQRVSSGVNDKS